MKLSHAGLLLGIASAALVVVLVVLDARSASPGEISAVHARSADIDEDDCAVCHGEAAGGLRAACEACHAEVAAQIAERRGFHGQLADPGRCGACHGEHHGEEFQLNGPAAFALAGFARREDYRHEGLSFELAGRHAALDCRACHANADAELLARDARRFQGASQDCASCHEDPHQGKLPDCRACHGESERFERVAAFAHPASFELAGAHARAGCVDCHAPGTRFAIEAGGSPAATRAPRACADCHDSPHAPAFLAAEPRAGCADCHPVSGGPFLAPRALTAPEHGRSGFALETPHADLACAQCHPRGAASFRAAHPGRAADDCAACHADPHRGQFATPAERLRTCLDCHERAHFDPPRFGLAEHARTGFALSGAHERAACHACHASAHAGEPRRFRGTSSSCAECHADAHTGFFARAAAPELSARAQDCASCHATTTFAAVAEFDHAAWTGFALEGRHAQTSCFECHPPGTDRDEHGRRFGRARQAFPGPAQACASCHADVHAGFFDGGGGLADPADCAACHSAQDFGAARAGFEHARWTGFELEGAHARMDCASCHPRQPAWQRRTTLHRSQAPYDDCQACHADPHGGRFDAPGTPAVVDGERGCERCHTSERFRPLEGGRFDHALWTGFALEGAHARLDCASCHPSQAPAGPHLARARGTSCADCHADPHRGQFARGGATDCARCHASEPDFHALTFDHQRDARFALDERHARLDCAACHRPWPLAGGGSALRYRPLGTACGDCHDPRTLRGAGGDR